METMSVTTNNAICIVKKTENKEIMKNKKAQLYYLLPRPFTPFRDRST